MRQFHFDFFGLLGIGVFSKLFSQSVLGPPIGSTAGCAEYLNDSERKYEKTIKRLVRFVKMSPQNANACFTEGVQNKLLFLRLSTSETSRFLGKIESSVSEKLLPPIGDKI